jgi:RHS repeat-associated protein
VLQGTTRFYVVTDLAGTPLLVTDANGAPVQSTQRDAYGAVIGGTADVAVPFGFAGGLEDPATGLVLLGSRDYDPQAGRWMQPDPSLYASGQWNAFAYAGDDPTSLMDQTGLTGSTIGDPQDPCDNLRQKVESLMVELMYRATALTNNYNDIPWCGSQKTTEYGSIQSHMEEFESKQRGLTNTINKFNTYPCNGGLPDQAYLWSIYPTPQPIPERLPGWSSSQMQTPETTTSLGPPSFSWDRVVEVSGQVAKGVEYALLGAVVFVASLPLIIATD